MVEAGLMICRAEEVNGGNSYFTTYQYDAADALIKVTNHLGHNTHNVYDLLGRKIAMCDPNMGTASTLQSCSTGQTGAWVYTYNLAGDLLTQKDAKNQTLCLEYDVVGRPTVKKQGATCTGTTLVVWTYDDPAVLYSKGRVTRIVDQASTTQFVYDQLGRVTQTQRQLLGVWHTMSQSYDALNRITSETFPDSETVNYSYNTAGWLSSVSGYINGITYNARGQKTQLTYANGLITTWTYNVNNFRVTNRTTSNNQQNLTYGYDNNGNVTSITDSLFTGSRTFQYDDLNRLINAAGTFGPNQSQTACIYGYSAIGDITNKCGTLFTYGDSMHPSAVTHNPLTGKNYTYDQNGNMLTRGNQTLTWDIDNRVSQVSISGGGSTLMEYDYAGMRVKKNAPSGITLYPFQGYEIDPNGIITKFIRIGIETFASKKGTNKYFYHNDHLGGVNVITDIAGTRVQLNEYDPWGSVSRAVGSIDPTHRFNGKELDPETGLYYYGGRYYDPEISRFISPDPFVQNPFDPQNLNRYSYVINNPQNYIDPDGYFHQVKKKGGFFRSFFGFFIGAIITALTWGGGAPIMVAAAIGGAVGGTVNAALNGGNPFTAGLIAGFTAGLFAGLMPPGLESPALTQLFAAAAASNFGVSASGFGPRASVAYYGADPNRFIDGAVKAGCVPGDDFCSTTPTPVLLATVFFGRIPPHIRMKPSSPRNVPRGAAGRRIRERGPQPLKDAPRGDPKQPDLQLIDKQPHIHPGPENFICTLLGPGGPGCGGSILLPQELPPRIPGIEKGLEGYPIPDAIPDPWA
jgi:RHS repeat-associated protein